MYDSDMDTVTVSSEGQIAIPEHVRQQLNIREGTRLKMAVEADRITLEKDTTGWRQLRGCVAGSDLLSAHMAEKREELARDQVRP